MINFLRSFRLNNNLLLLLFTSGIIMYRLLICVNYTPEISVGETNNIWNALNVANGRSIYCNPEDTPFEIFQYTPLSQIPIVVFAKMFDNNSSDYWYHVLVAGRISSLIFNLLTFYLLYLLLHKLLKIDKTLSLASVVCGFGLLTHLSFAVRPDALSLLVTISSIYLFSIAYFQDKSRYYFFCGFLFAFSFFVKQDSFLILSALGLCLLMEKKWKDLLKLAFTFIVAFAFLLTTFHFLYGNYFFVSIIGGLAMEYSIKQAVDVFERFLHFYSVWFYLGLFCSYLIIRGFALKKEGSFILTLGIVSFCIALSTSFKMGSWINYYTQYIIYSIILIYYVVGFIKTHDQVVRSAVTFFTIIVVSVFLLQQIFHYTSPFLKYQQSKDKHELMANSFKDFKKKIELTNQFVFIFDKQVKLFLYKNTLFPNTEFYHHSRFSIDKYDKLPSNRKLHYVLCDDQLNDDQLMTLKHFQIPFNEFQKNNQILNYSIYELKR